MALVLTYTRKVRQALTATAASLGVGVMVLLGIAGIIAVIAAMLGRASAPMQAKVVIDLRFRVLPYYTMLSLGRGLAAYVLSLAFTLIYGTIAAHNRAAEKVMLPAL